MEIRDIKGWMSDKEMVCLSSLTLATNHLKGDIVEIGSYQGKSTITIAKNTRKKVHAIDPYVMCTSKAIKNNIKRFKADNVRLYEDYSGNVSEHFINKKIAFLFIDGDHSYEGCKQDILLYQNNIVQGGYIAFHDAAYFSGVFKSIKDTIMASDDYSSYAIVGSIVFAKKSPCVGIRLILNRLKVKITVSFRIMLTRLYQLTRKYKVFTELADKVKQIKMRKW
jgi:predicted O-methyltransferase YrrM